MYHGETLSALTEDAVGQNKVTAKANNNLRRRLKDIPVFAHAHSALFNFPIVPKSRRSWYLPSRYAAPAAKPTRATG